jgi:hypothetical protein
MLVIKSQWEPSGCGGAVEIVNVIRFHSELLLLVLVVSITQRLSGFAAHL